MSAPADRGARAGLWGLRWLAGRLGPTAAPGDTPLAQIDEESLRAFDRLSFVSRHRAAAGPGGEHRSRMRAPSTDFADYRPYQPGDDFRRIDWNVYGRLGTLQIRQTEALERHDITLALDCSASMRWGEPDKLEHAARIAAALGYVGLARYDRLRVVCLGTRNPAFGPVRGRARFHELVQYLVGVEPAGRIDLGAQIASCVSTSSPRGQPLVILLSDLLTPADLGDAFDAVQRAGADIVVIHILSPQEQAPDPYGEVEMVDAETGDVVEVGLSVETVRRYRERFDQWMFGLEELFNQRALRYVRTSTDRSVRLLLLDDLRRRQVLR